MSLHYLLKYTVWDITLNARSFINFDFEVIHLSIVYLPAKENTPWTYLVESHALVNFFLFQVQSTQLNKVHCLGYYAKYAKLHITKTRLFKYIKKFTSQNWKFSDKKLWYFFIFLPRTLIVVLFRLEPPRWCGSNEYPQSMFLSRNKKNNVYPCRTPFLLDKSGVYGGQNYIGVFSWRKLRLWMDASIHRLAFLQKKTNLEIIL